MTSPGPVVLPLSGIATLLRFYDLQGVIEKGDSMWTLTLGTVYLAAPPRTVKSQGSYLFWGSHSATDFWKVLGGQGERCRGGGLGRGMGWSKGCGRRRTGERDVGALVRSARASLRKWLRWNMLKNPRRVSGTKVLGLI